MYSGFISRSLAGAIDFVLLLPMSLVALLICQRSLAATIAAVILLQVIKNTYFIVCHKYTGQTIGKYLAGIRVVDSEFHEGLNWSRSILRNTLELLFSLVRIGGTVWAAYQISRYSFAATDWPYLANRFKSFDPVVDWVGKVMVLITISEPITLMLNKRKQALQDWLGGTIVLQLEKIKYLPCLALFAFLSLTCILTMKYTESRLFQIPSQKILTESGINQPTKNSLWAKRLIEQDEKVLFFHQYNSTPSITTILTNKKIVRLHGKRLKKFHVHQISEIKTHHDFGGESDIVIRFRQKGVVKLPNIPKKYALEMLKASKPLIKNRQKNVFNGSSKNRKLRKKTTL